MAHHGRRKPKTGALKERPLQFKRRNPKTQSQRQEELRRVDAWLDRLHKEHPWRFTALTVGIALAVLGLAMLLKWLVS